MSKSKKAKNKNGTNVEMLDAYKCQHMIVRNFNALTLTRTFSPSLLFLFSTFSFFGIFMFRHFYFRPKLGLPCKSTELIFGRPSILLLLFDDCVGVVVEVGSKTVASSARNGTFSRINAFFK